MAADGASIARNQAHTFLALWATLVPYLQTDRMLPARLDRQLRLHRQFGSRDRRLYRELAYTAFRYLPWVEDGLKEKSDDAVRALVWLSHDLAATRLVKSVWCEGWPLPAPAIAEKQRRLQTQASSLPVSRPLLPEWFRGECPEAFHPPLGDILQTRSPLWIRVQTDDVDGLAAEFRAQGWTWRQSVVQADAWRIDGEKDVTDSEAFRKGAFEVQDLGSQLVLESIDVPVGSRWLDACAGAGGKTLQLARRVGSEGHVTADDLRPAPLEELRRRAERGGLRNVSVGDDGRELFDGVLIDAPCSGTGTWRRSPHLKTSTNHEGVVRSAVAQTDLLETYAPRLHLGGRLVYATCSLCRTENEDVVNGFLESHSDYRADRPIHEFGYRRARDETGLTIDPAGHDSDGFYVACLQRVS